ncbi:hypothetical protein [Burkholderia ubonensis]|uniref:hypothetical protein n=1 Tax=Burkholderia ubonensis TaxID=101571 RepID=UPI000B20F259|nr:hypothetical protein [Burkholderia ubonensis]
MSDGKPRWKSGRHMGGERVQRRLKRITIRLLQLIKQRSGLSPVELEQRYDFGLRGTFDVETGQEWRRYVHEPSSEDRRKNQALSIDRLRQVAADALAMQHVTLEDLRELGLLQLLDESNPRSRFKREQKALGDFRAGLKRYSKGQAPLASGGGKGGCPRKLAKLSVSQRLEAWSSWLVHLACLGGVVFEDRDSVADLDLSLQQLAANEGRIVTDSDFQQLVESDRPFDPAHPTGGALNRLRIRFVGGNLDEPWCPTYVAPPIRWDQLTPEPWADISAQTATPAESHLFFKHIEENLRESSGFERAPPSPLTPDSHAIAGERLDIEAAVDILQASFIRSGDVLSLDRIVELPAEERLMYVALIASRAGSADALIASVFAQTRVIDTLKQETIKRTSMPQR